MSNDSPSSAATPPATETRTARSGFHHVRYCNDCNAPIGPDDACGCVATTAFVKGALVTVCDENGPTETGTIGRVGNGAFRLAGTSRWFSLVTGEQTHPPRVHTNRLIARLAQPGDAEVLAKKAAKEAMDAELHKLRDKREILLNAARNARGASYRAGLAAEKKGKEEERARAEKENLQREAKSMEDDAIRSGSEAEAISAQIRTLLSGKGTAQ